MFLRLFVDGVGARVLAGASVVVMSGVMLVASAPPAAAHDTCVHHPSDPDALGSGADNSVACLRSDHSIIDACDRHSDGHKVWARVRYSNGNVMSFEDDNGANPGCGNYPPGWHGFHISYNVCVETEGCGSPLYRPGYGYPTW